MFPRPAARGDPALVGRVAPVRSARLARGPLPVAVFEAAIVLPTLAALGYFLVRRSSALEASLLYWMALIVLVDLLPVPAWHGLQLLLDFPLLLAVAILYEPPAAAEFLVSYLGLGAIGVIAAELFLRVGFWGVLSVLIPVVLARQMFSRSLTLETARQELATLYETEQARVGELEKLDREKAALARM